MTGSPAATVRPATTDDVPAIHRVAHETWPDTYDDVLGPDAVASFLADYYSEASLRRDVERDGGVFLVAEAADSLDGRTADTVVGYAEAGPSEGADDDDWTLARLYVLPAWQGEGVGSALLHRVETAARDAGVESVRLVVLGANDPAVAFYEAAGYGHAETRDGELVDAPERVYRRQV